MLESLLYQVNRIVKHLGADAQLSALINHPNGHDIACLPPAEHAACPTEESFLHPLHPALPLPPLPIYCPQHALILIALLLYPRHAAPNQHQVLTLASLNLVEAAYSYDILLVDPIVELLGIIYGKPLLMELPHILLVLLVQHLVLDIIISESVVADDV